MDRLCSLFRFLAYGFSCLLGLSANSLGGLLGFFSNCFGRFFCVALYFIHRPFLPECGKCCSRDQRDNQSGYFHDFLLLICCLYTNRTDEETLSRALAQRLKIAQIYWSAQHVRL